MGSMFPSSIPTMDMGAKILSLISRACTTRGCFPVLLVHGRLKLTMHYGLLHPHACASHYGGTSYGVVYWTVGRKKAVNVGAVPALVMGPLYSVQVFPFVLKTAKAQLGSTHRPGQSAKVVAAGATVDDAVTSNMRGTVARPLVVCTAEVCEGSKLTNTAGGEGL